MLTRGRYYPEQEASVEPIVIFVRRHWFSFFPWIILIAVMAICPIIVLTVLATSINFNTLESPSRVFIILLTSTYYLFTLSVFLVAWIDYYLDVTIVTSKRLVDIHQNGLFNHRVSEQSLLRVQDVSVRVEGPFQTFFKFGTVYVETAGEAPNFEMVNLPNPNYIADTILKLHYKLVEEGYHAAETGEAEGTLYSQNHKDRHKHLE